MTHSLVRDLGTNLLFRPEHSQLEGAGNTPTIPTPIPGVGGGGPSIAFGMASRRQTGPFDVGFPDGTDKHLLGFDADGHAINSLHLSTNTLWIGDGVNDEASNAGQSGASYLCCPGGDAPLEFNCWKEPEEGIYPVPVRLGYDPESQHQWCGGPRPGLWRWWAMCNYYVAQPQGQQTGPGSRRAGSACNIQGHGGSAVSPRRTGSGSEPFVATVVQTASPVNLGRPNLIRPSFADLRTNTSPDAQSLLAADLYTPITYRMEAYGAQGGACSGSVLGSNDGYTGKWIPGETWNYTELPGQGRFQGGTASGGVVLMPPEVDMADIDEDLAPNGRTLSTTFMIAAPGARFGAGLPNLADGAMDAGYSWFVEDGKLVFNLHTGDCPGLGTGVLELDTDGDMTLSGNLILSSTLPILRFDDTDAPANEKLWDIRAASSILSFQSLDDGEMGSPWLEVRRTGSNVDSVLFVSTPVGMGILPLTNMANGDLVLQGGSLVLNEITTPTADADYGKVYTKSDNKIYFQDGAGTEHEIAFV